MWILNYLRVPKIMTFRCFVGQFSLVTEGQNRHTKTDQCQIFMLTSTQICILHNGMAFSVISIIIWCQKYHRAPEIKFWTMTWHFLPLQKSMWQAVNLTLVKAVQFKQFHNILSETTDYCNHTSTKLEIKDSKKIPNSNKKACRGFNIYFNMAWTAWKVKPWLICRHLNGF